MALPDYVSYSFFQSEVFPFKGKKLICHNQDKCYFMQSKPRDYSTLSCGEQYFLISQLFYMEMNTASGTPTRNLKHSVSVNSLEGGMVVSTLLARSFLLPINLKIIVEKHRHALELHSKSNHSKSKHHYFLCLKRP